MNSSAGRGIQTAVKAFEIIRRIQELEGATLSQLSDDLDMANSTLYDYLETLVQIGYLTKENGVYDLSLRFLDHGTYTKEKSSLLSHSRKSLINLADETGATVWLIVEENGEAVYLENAFGDQAIRTEARCGKREHMHCIASGRCMLAYFSEERIDEIIAQHGLPVKTSNTIETRDVLFENIQQVKERGYAVNNEENVEGLFAIAAPIVVQGTPRGAIAISGPAARMKDESYREDIIERITSHTNEIELKMTYDH